MTISADTYSALADVSVAFILPTPSGLDDAELIEAQRTLAEIRRRVDAAAAVMAAEIRHRSRRELGYDGLAQRLGARTPELLVQELTGSSAREAQSLVRVGGMMTADADPWLRAVSMAVSSGELSVDRADAIRAGLGTPDGDVSSADLARTAGVLLREASSLSLEKLAARARDLRNALDLEGVHDREQKLRDRRYLRISAQADGMTRLSGLLDPESAAIVVAAYDGATSPRRGGPRFVDPGDVDRAEELIKDERTTEQITVDAFVELIRVGTLAESGAIVGARKPGVTVHVTAADLQAGIGVGHIDGQSGALSIATVERLGCELGFVAVLFDSEQAIDVGRNQRLFTYRQRVALEARDGGCRFPGCNRPPSWTEAHHLNEWRNGGRTDITDGILLCRHHHMLVHNNGWRVIRRGTDYFVVPPATIDPAQRPISAPSKSPTLRRQLMGARAGAGAG